MKYIITCQLSRNTLPSQSVVHTFAVQEDPFVWWAEQKWRSEFDTSWTGCAILYIYQQ